MRQECSWGGVNCTWAEEVFGTTSDGYLAAKSTSITMYDGGTLHYVFSQTTRATNNYDGFVVVAEDRGGTKLIALRQDNWDNVAASNTGCTNTYNWTNFPALLNGASVDMTITYNSGTFTMSSTITGSDSQNYSYGYTKAIAGSPNAIVVYLSEEASQITLTTSEYSNENVIVATLDHTLSSSRDGSNPVVKTTTIDQETEHYNNTKAANWGGWAYAQFSFTIPTGHSVESASLMWGTNIGGNNTTNRDNTIYYINAGTSIDYSDATSERNLTSSATSITNVVLAGKTIHKDVVTDVTSAVRTIAASQNYIIFEWTNSASGADLYGKASTYSPVLVIKTTSETFYEATFTESNSLSPTVTIYSDEDRTVVIENGGLSANTTYYYTATLAGYNDYNGSFAVETSNPTVNFTMTTKPRYTFTVNLVNSVGDAVLETIYTDDDSYDGKAHYVYFSKYLTDENHRVTYTKDNDTYYTRYVSASGSATQTVSYTAYNGVAYFVEGESLATLKNTKVESGNLSGNYGGRGLNNSTTDVLTIPVTGTYNMTYAACSNNVNASRTYSFYKNSSDNVLETQSCNWSINSVKTTGTKTLSDLSFAAGDVIKFYGADTQITLDYVFLELTNLTGTIASSGWSSLATAYGLDFTGATGLSNAFVVTSISKDAVTLTSVDEISANSGVILKGEGSAAYNIPVKAGATYSGTNKLQAAVTATDVEANEAYILQGGLFHLVTEASTVPAGKAYLLASDVPAAARSLSFIFDEETTGIAPVSTDRLNGEFYNLQGQRINNPKQGLYIVNGKKVIIK